MVGTRWFRTFTVILAAAGFLSSIDIAAAVAGQRVALVIGNASYAHAPALANPLNDASDIGAVLERLGFAVTRLENADQAALRRGLQAFALAASASEIAVVFYAGHGIEVDQRNYLVPVDARLASDQDVEFETVPLELVSRAVARASGLRLVILDACRENPFAASMQRAGATRSIGRGLARVEPSGETLVAYAAKEGTVASDGDGRNSPYSAALLGHLAEPGLEVGLMFRKVRDAVLASTGGRQEPFVYGSLSSRGAVSRSAARLSLILLTGIVFIGRRASRKRAGFRPSDPGTTRGEAFGGGRGTAVLGVGEGHRGPGRRTSLPGPVSRRQVRGFGAQYVEAAGGFTGGRASGGGGSCGGVSGVFGRACTGASGVIGGVAGSEAS